eukprot:gene15292-16870_t
MNAKDFSLLVATVVIVACVPVFSLRCPVRSSNEADVYKVQERLDKLTTSLKDKLFTSQAHSHKRTVGGKTTEDVYDYTLKVCTPDNDFRAAYQVDVGKGNSKRVVIGQSNASYALGGTDWILIVYGDGQKYKSYCDKESRETWVKVICDKSGADTKLKVLEESRWRNDDKTKIGCYYLLELNHKAVCSAKESKLSGGAIFCIILFSLAVAYLLFGFLFQRFAKGAKGWEQIPNYTFWRKVGNMSADGCDFVCRRPDRPTGSYKGMADALDIDTSDDEHDDHLLPM